MDGRMDMEGKEKSLTIEMRNRGKRDKRVKKTWK